MKQHVREVLVVELHVTNQLSRCGSARGLHDATDYSLTAREPSPMINAEISRHNMVALPGRLLEWLETSTRQTADTDTTEVLQT